MPATDTQVAVSFGSEGFLLYVDGVLADAEVEFHQGLEANDNSILLGASTMARDGANLRARDYFQGTIHDFSIYDEPIRTVVIFPWERAGAIDAAIAEL